MSTDTDSADSTPQWKMTAENYRKVRDKGGVQMHILRGGCDAERSTRDGGCTFQARYRRFFPPGSGHGKEVVAEERCGMHVPQEWKDVLHGERDADYEVLDMKSECEKGVTRSMKSPETFTARPLGSDEPEAVDVPERMRSESEQRTKCEHRGFLMFVYEDTQNKVYCKTHARDMWLSIMRSNGGDEHSDSK